MPLHLRPQLDELRLDLYHAWLRRRERAELRRSGERIATSGSGCGQAEVARVRAEMQAGLVRIAQLEDECRASLAADRSDFAIVAPWVKPVVAARGLFTRLVLRHRLAVLRRGLEPHYVALGELAATECFYPVERQDAAGATTVQSWRARAAAEGVGFGRAVLAQLRSHLLPRAPALAGLVVGWWIANTYTDSHLKSVLRSVGIGKGGTRVVSSSTYEAMSFWLPLLAAALCAYLGERFAAHYAPSVERFRPAAQPSLPEKGPAYD